MKKFTFFLMLCCMSVFAFGAETTVAKTVLDIVGSSTTNGTQVGTLYSDEVLTISTNTDGNNGKIYSAGTEWRLYQTNKGVVTVSITSGTLKSVSFTFSNANTGTLLYDGTAMTSETPVDVTGTSVSFSVGNSASATNGQIKIKGFSVVYETTGGSSTPVEVTGVSLDQTAITLTEGKTQQLTATVEPTNATDKSVKWESDNTGVATVVDGLVSAVAKGTATITVTTTDGAKTATCTVTVEEKKAGVEEDVVLTFPDENKANNSQSSYKNSWEAKIGDYTWNIVNFNNNKWGWTNIRCGHKTTEYVATITTAEALYAKIAKVVVTVDAVTADKVNSTKLYVASDAEFTKDLQTIPVTIATGDVEFVIPTPANNLYYKIEIDCQVNSSANGFVQISKVQYLIPEDPTKPALDVASTLDFGSIELKDGKAENTETLNVKATYLTDLITITKTGANADNFTVAATMDNGGGDLEVKFSATAAGDYTATLTLTSGSLSKEVTLTAKVTEPAKPITTLAELKALGAGTNNITLTDALVTYITGTNAYIQDATAGAYLYKVDLVNSLKVGDKISGTFSVTSSIYRNLYEITAVTAEGTPTITNGNDVTPQVVTIADLNANYDKYEAVYVKIENATVTSTFTSKSATIAQGESTLTLRDQNTLATITATANDNVDVAGWLGAYNTAYQLHIWEQSQITVKSDETKKKAYITFDETEIELEKGKTGSNDIAVYYLDDKSAQVEITGAKVSYVSSDATVATVDANTGVVTAVGAGTATITATFVATEDYYAATESYTVKVTDPDAPDVITWDLSTNTSSEATEDLVTWTSTIATMTNAKGASSTKANNYLATSDAHTRFYKDQVLSVTPASGYEIIKIEITSTTSAYAKTLSESTWTNATSSYNETLITVTPTDGKATVSVTFGNATRATSVKVYYKTYEVVKTPSITVNKDEIDFGTVTLSGESVEGSTLLTITGQYLSETLGITLSIIDDEDGVFSVNGKSTPDKISAEGATVTVEYTAIEAGEYAATLVIGAWDEEEKAITAKNVSLKLNVVSGSTPPAGDGKYVKVTSEQTDWSGKYLIVYEDGNVAFNGGLTDKLDATSNTISITIADDAIAATDETNAAAFVIAKVDDAYTIQSVSGLYLAQTSDANGMSSAYTTANTNTINYDTENSCVNIIGGGAYLRYNASSGQERFRYFKSATYDKQKAIQLYKYTENGTIGTSVENVEPIEYKPLDLDAPMYNVLGQRVDASYKGIVIQNGQKYLLR